MNKYWYVFDLNPISWRVGPAGVARSGSTGKTRAYIGRDAELHNYQQAVKEELNRQGACMLDGPVVITAYFWRNLSSFQGEKKKTRDHQSDGTNMLKALEDACQGILFKNDSGNVTGLWHIIEQGPNVEAKIILSVELASSTHKDDVVQNIPDEVFNEAFPRGQAALIAATEGSNRTIKGDGSRYETADEIF